MPRGITARIASCCPPDVRKILERLNLRVTQLENQLRRLQEKTVNQTTGN